MKKLFKFISILSFIVVIPVVASAQVAGPCGVFNGLTGVLCKIHELLNSVIPVLVALGVLYFVWGVVQYVIGDGEEAKKKGRDRMIFGIIGLAVIISVWGLVYIVTNTFGTDKVAPSNGYLQDLLPK